MAPHVFSEQIYLIWGQLQLLLQRLMQGLEGSNNYFYLFLFYRAPLCRNELTRGGHATTGTEEPACIIRKGDVK